MTTFAEIVDAAYELDASEQATLVEILNRQLYEKRRTEILADSKETDREFVEGKLKPMCVEEIMREITCVA